MFKSSKQNIDNYVTIGAVGRSRYGSLVSVYHNKMKFWNLLTTRLYSVVAKTSQYIMLRK